MITSGSRDAAAEQARRRIADRFIADPFDRKYPTSPATFDVVARAMRRSPRDAEFLDIPLPKHHDLLDALTVVDDARAALNFHLDIDELEVIARLRAAGTSWHEIGRALGYPEATAARDAYGRWRRLRKRHPGNADAIDEQLAEERLASGRLADTQPGHEPPPTST